MKGSFLKTSILAGLLAFCAIYAVAQPKLYPIRLHQISQSGTNARTQGDSAVFVTLPFFDDFAGQVGVPDTNKWENSGGVYINNTFGIDAHTIGVATFDGLRESGVPYSLDALGITGEADRLTSHCFDFSANTVADNITLSFYWQAQGLGELPNAEDFIKLEFRDSTGEWIEQWQVTGDTLTAFEYVELVIDDASFLHDRFQFRFVNFGRLSGGYDTWNIDYIYFNTAANRISDIPVDFGFTGMVSQRLSPYSSLPAHHLLANIDSVWQDTLTVAVRSAFAQARNFRRVSLETEVYAPDSVAGSFLPFLNNQSSLDPLDTAQYIFENDKSLLTGLDVDSLAISYTFVLDLLSQASDEPLTRLNDTLRVVDVYADYYAYDDGSAELGYGVSEKFGKIAYQFETLQDDTLRYVDIFLAQLGGQASGSFKIKVWESIDTLSGEDVELFSSTSYPILYTDGVNTFQRLVLDDYLPLPKGTFFIGFEQLSDQNIMIGFDKNRDSGDKIFYNLGTKWFQNKQFRGSLMLRPGFEFPSTVTGIEEDLAELKQVVIYPNPVSKQFFWLKGEVNQIALYTLSGKQVFQKVIRPKGLTKVEIPNLSGGLYILKIQKGAAVTAQKLFIQQP